MKARITVRLKSGVLDPQGKAIEGALASLGFGGVESVRQGKVFDIELAETDRAAAEAKLRQMADRLLANPVIESYDIELRSDEDFGLWLERLTAAPAAPLSQTQSFPDRGGCYVIEENGVFLYVGISKSIRQRMRNHTSGRPEQSAFAFKLARQEAGRKTDYTKTNSMKTLSVDPEFLDAFARITTRVRAMTARFILIDDANSRYLFEHYAATRLNTPYNDFNTH